MLKINKAKARKIFNEGVYPYTRYDILICPCKMRPDNMWMPASNLVNPLTYEGNTFYEMINGFEYYNCSYETGYYTAFYLIEKF